jgi:hypothetical protein
VWQEMNRRERLFGIAEKWRKAAAKAQPKVAVMSARRLRKRR